MENEEQTLTPETEVPETTPEVATEVPTVEEIKVPENWEQPVKDFFASDVFKNDPTAKKAFFDKFKSFDDGYQKKFNDLAGKEKEFNAKREAFDKQVSQLSAYSEFEKALRPEDRTAIYSQFGGIAPYLANLYQLDQQFSADPMGFIQGIMARANITPEMLINGAKDPQYQAQLAQKQHSQELGNLRQEMLAEVERRFKADAFEKEVRAFESAVGEDGKPLHPHLSAVADMMDYYMSQNPSMSLQEAYDNACYAVPEVRAQVLQAQLEAQAAEKVRQDELAKAKKAQGLATTPKPANTKQQKDYRSVLDERLAAMYGEDEE